MKLLPFCFLLLFTTILHAQTTLPNSASAPANIFGFLQQFDPLEVVIETDIKLLKSDLKTEKWQPGVFKIMDGKTVMHEQPVQISSRGAMRKKTCEFPPVKIKFYELENDSLEDINELKLVSSCRESLDDEQLVLKECLAYELYSELTEQSFRVKPAKIEFKNTGKKGSVKNGFSFFIESERELASRLNGKPLKPRIMSPQGLDKDSYDRMCIFQYMIGNTDWSVTTRHNIKIIGIKGLGTVAIPYDFDYAGMVGADYAVPSPRIPIESVQERYYMGFCRENAEYEKIVTQFKNRQAAIFQRCESYPNLSWSARTQVKNYLDSFFDLLKDSQSYKDVFKRGCESTSE